MRLFDADEAMKFLRESKVKETGAFSKGINKGLNIALSALGNSQITPTIEAAPVIHAAWKWGLNRYKQHGAWCTNCGCGWEYKPGDFDRVQGLVNAHKYCPNCGAKMDK